MGTNPHHHMHTTRVFVSKNYRPHMSKHHTPREINESHIGFAGNVNTTYPIMVPNIRMFIRLFWSMNIKVDPVVQILMG